MACCLNQHRVIANWIFGQNIIDIWNETQYFHSSQYVFKNVICYLSAILLGRQYVNSQLWYFWDYYNKDKVLYKH